MCTPKPDGKFWLGRNASLFQNLGVLCTREVGEFKLCHTQVGFQGVSYVNDFSVEFSQTLPAPLLCTLKPDGKFWLGRNAPLFQNLGVHSSRELGEFKFKLCNTHW